MLPRLSALLLLVTLPACIEARAPSDAPACTSEVECGKLYRAALVRLQACLRELKAAGYVSPGATAPPGCDAVRAETAALANALARFNQRKQEPGDEQERGFEVPPLPAAK